MDLCVAAVLYGAGAGGLGEDPWGKQGKAGMDDAKGILECDVFL